MQQVAEGSLAEMDALRARVATLEGAIRRIMSASGLADTMTGDGQIWFGQNKMAIHPINGIVVYTDDGLTQWFLASPENQVLDPDLVIGLSEVRGKVDGGYWRLDGTDGLVPSTWYIEAKADGAATEAYIDLSGILVLGDKVGGLGAGINATQGFRFVNLTSAAAEGGGGVTASAGRVYFNTTASNWRGYDGTSWVTIGPSSGGGLAQETSWMSSIIGGPFP